MPSIGWLLTASGFCKSGSTMMPLNESRSADQQSARRNSADGTDPDLEDKPLPPQVPAGTPADLNLRRDPSTKQGRRKWNRTDWSDPRSSLNTKRLVEVAKQDFSNDEESMLQEMIANGTAGREQMLRLRRQMNEQGWNRRENPGSNFASSWIEIP
ncbi:Hypothetical protein PHPALM_5805 [Phytophthora palmivora]|uniref:Uncharacterized protein n=1 Tax=Phytophthora palmivora TaxID=4796 RepID=A0A2P4YGF6_9STRA|nr:Hypothetical protein PHPALM_5805 [Phytophthora palmivora]